MKQQIKKFPSMAWLLLAGSLLASTSDAFSPTSQPSFHLARRHPQLFSSTTISPIGHKSESSWIQHQLEGLSIPQTAASKKKEYRFWETTAQQKQQQKSKTTEYPVPTVKDILKFAVPAIGVWLCQPLLSMIDTSTVGLLAGTAQQAALNPAIAVINYMGKLIAFLFSGTTTMIAAAQEADRRQQQQQAAATTNDDDIASDDKPHTAKTLVGALQLSLLTGIAMGGLVFCFARQLLLTIIGSGTAVDPAILGPAIQYTRLRALSFPAVALLGSAQTACLAMRDIRAPVYMTAIAAASNLLLDVLLIRPCGGAAGAAWATTVSQYLAMGWCIRWLLNKRSTTCDNNNNTSTSSNASNRDSSSRGFLSGRMRVRDLIRLPNRETRKHYSQYVVPVFTTQAGRASTCATIDHVVTSAFSTASMAANQIVTSVYYGLVPVADSISLAAQNFVPQIMTDDGNPQQQARAMKRLIGSFLKVAGLCGLFLAAIMGTLPLYGGAFTADPAVRRLVSTVVPYLFVTCLKHGVFCASEGILLGQKDMTFLGAQYTAYTFLVPYILLQIKKAALGGSTRVGLLSVWQVFLGYDLFRTVLQAGRILWLQRKMSKKQVCKPPTNEKPASFPQQGATPALAP